MIHYTLLPEKETKFLKKEYKIRLFIISAFFICCGVMIGVISLLPAFILSKYQEKEALDHIQSIKNEGQQKEITTILVELSDSSKIIKKIKEDQSSIVFSNFISEIILHKNGQISINSIKMSIPNNASSSIEVILQGKASSRESLVTFKKDLENDARIINTELPISDLAKSKNISFAIKFNMTQ